MGSDFDVISYGEKRMEMKEWLEKAAPPILDQDEASAREY